MSSCPFAERRIHDREHVETVVEIAAKLLVRNHRDEVPVRGGQQPDIDANRPGAAEPFELLLLQHTQQLRLQLQRNIADLVQEERAAVRHLEAADPLGDCPGKGALLVSEELAF